jgi:TRAP-type C4-dicarboxylate transport system permease small subunit
MANTLLPIEERNLTPQEVELLDRRRRRGQLFLVLCVQCLIVGALVSLWAGQDWTLSPGWTHPMVYWDAAMFGAALVFGVTGVRLRRGSNEFFSY